ncbi:protein N-lysine methyltransferase METTL21D-like [Microplitis mediator]|uniref:protein N-lysine methyltransferase METTL21D-like n=1 Tax=Microplitis mediator TaxID=375433 RepID=UPI0025569022|nr:protein N-lysine methyltransferase METTL21D-like [Microplitis mediator]
MEKNIFTRNFELESKDNKLTLYQQEIGDVNCVVWDAAIVLAKYLDYITFSNLNNKNTTTSQWLAGKKILELGAGIGCVGMTAACLGAHVVMTDLESAIPMLKYNISMNENQWKNGIGSVEARVIQWGTKIQFDFSPDIILLADCVYYSESIDPLIKTLEYFCKVNKNTYAILSQEERDTPGQVSVWQQFLERLKKVFKLEYIPRSDQHPVYSSDDIHLIKLTIL